MSKNKGKDGEMRVAKLLCDISTKEENCDFTRPTNTNTANGGGSKLSKGAKKNFDDIKKAVKEDGKVVSYISNSGLRNLEEHYQALPSPDDNSED
ncbi:conserved hypothetical protein [Candidatus Magnetomoraceae bacterium gMMP-13]